jgi:L-ascorbate metabolism protein UlaG (beta-lactamase superfamily)
MNVDELPHVDAIIMSHDHYDHLDYETFTKLKGKVDRFFVPLGVGAHLEKWGIAPSQITELDWNESAKFDDLTLVCAPARHFSGRGLTNRKRNFVVFMGFTGNAEAGLLRGRYRLLSGP